MLKTEQLVRMYERMLLIREFEARAILLFKSGVIGGAVHPSIGQEAVAVGVCTHLEKKDCITSTHRGHGHSIAKGADINRMMAELVGKATGYCRGKGGSMHISDPSIGILGSNGIVGAGIPIAVGAAYKLQYGDEKGRVVVCFFGDGAANQGVFHEGINMAAIWGLPIVFVCENNVWAISTRSDYASSGKSIGNRACAYGIPGKTIDGNDLLTVYDASGEAIDRARSGGGPTLIECRTYRVEGHFVGDPRVYCDKSEVEEWKKLCPIRRLESSLLAQGTLDEQKITGMKEEAKQLVDGAVRFAEESPFPPLQALTRDVYGTEGSEA